MTRKDFELIARHMAALNPGNPASAVDDAAEQAYRQGYKAAVNQVCSALSSANPRFDRYKFLSACGYAD